MPRAVISLLPCALLLLGSILPSACRRAAPRLAPPDRLADTGLYSAFATRTVHPDLLSFTPQYPLWTDGAAKQRWIALPPGSAIDASDPDHWDFPAGTRLWKQFDFAGRPVETRFMQRHADGSWLYATYRWRDDGSDAVLAPASGVRNACPTTDGKSHDLPSVDDCRSCHEGTRTTVLGFSALQLSPDRDPLAPHASAPAPGDVDLPALVARGLLQNLPPRFLQEPPRVVARSERERAALGYLHGNCSNCHNGDGPLQRLGLRFDHPLATTGAPPALETTLGVASQFIRGDATVRVAPGAPERSVLARRLAATDPLTQMPPFGRHLADHGAVELIRQWIAHDLAADVASTPAATTATATARKP
jgi:hypothetical protein